MCGGYKASLKDISDEELRLEKKLIIKKLRRKNERSCSISELH